MFRKTAILLLLFFSLVGIWAQTTMDSLQLLVFPNPAVSEVIFKISKNYNSKVTVNIYNITGNKVSTPIQSTYLSEGIHEVKYTIDSLNDGMYYAQLLDDKGNRSTAKLLKRAGSGQAKKRTLNAGVAIYPNPAHDLVKISASLPKGSLVNIYNMAGQLLKQQDVNGSEVDLANIAAQPLYIRVVDKTGVVRYSGYIIKK
jgi:hypothetical protein